MRNKAAEARTKRAAATLAAEEAFSRAPLPGVGAEAWRTLWEAARRYAVEVAYPDRVFPPTDSESYCVLCHQTLPAEAAARMADFDRFVQADTSAAATLAEDALAAALQVLQTSRVRLQEFPLRHQLALRAPQVGAAVLRSLAVARERRRLCLTAPETLPEDLPASAPDPTPAIRELATGMDRYAEELKAAADPAGRQRLEQERDALHDRKALGVLLPKARDEVARLSTPGPFDQAWTRSSDQTVGTVPPSMTNSAPWIAAARSEAR
ncbi:hypothetical protein [Ancylobacter sp.]|uniref:hypothetical protein n=1 Tax=Ancylobacter sp. TaxID=1872567 RepID=UPI003D0C7263